MLRKIKTKKSMVLTEGEKNQIFGGSCPIACNCGVQCGDNLAFRQSKDSSGSPFEPPI